MSRQVKKVAVLGSGVMGSAIAAHFANAGIPSLVLDIVPREATPEEAAAGLDLSQPRVRNRLARESVAALARARPAPLFARHRLSLIEAGNLEDDLPRLGEADWVVEVVREDLGIKTQVLRNAAPHLRDDAVLSSNTSGLSLTEMARALPDSLRPRFLGTHFFNPPRYMRLLELVPTEHTSPEVLEFISGFSTRRLGKGVVRAKDTPNFIANRIGIHAMMAALAVMRRHELSIEEVDAITGPPMARPKTATFRLADLVGVDVIALVAGNLRGNAPDDECHELFEPPLFLRRMIERGLLGRKSGAGFYKKSGPPGARILTLDPETLEYRDPRPPDLPELKELSGIEDPAERLRRLVAGEGRAAHAAWEMLAATLSYASMRLGEIADDAATIDRAMKLGFNWELGPFEIWDALGFRPTCERLRGEKRPLPAWIERLHADGADALYEEIDGSRASPVADPGRRAPVAVDPRQIRLPSLRAAGRKVRGNGAASLVDLGEEVLGLEFHSKMNAIDEETIRMMHAAADEAEARWQALVVANQGDNFSAGANLKLIAGLAQRQDWKAIEAVVRSFQGACGRLERCGVPVVVAPHGMALGGGCEVVLAGDAVHAAAEAYLGLVEVGAGLIPAGGGCTRLYRRNVERMTDGADVYPALRATFETIGMAKVSGSAEEARQLGFLRAADGWSMHAEHRVHDAKQLALALARAGYAPELERSEVPVLGRGGSAVIRSALVNMGEGRFITEHDAKIGRELARVLSGGDTAGRTTVAEEHLLDLEVESFLKLCGEPKTHERIEALLRTGKPLRN